MNRHWYQDSDPHTDRDAYCDAYADGKSNVDTQCYAKPNTYCYAFINPDTYPNCRNCWGEDSRCICQNCTTQ